MVSWRARAVARLDRAVVAERDPVAVADLVGLLAVLAREPLVERELQAGHRGCRCRRGSRPGWRRRPGRVVAQRVGLGVDAAERDLAQVGVGDRALTARLDLRDHLGGQRGGHPAVEVLEAAARLGAAWRRVRRSSRGRAGRRGSGRSSPAYFAVTFGSAISIRPSTDSASATPLRSTIVPRLAGQDDGGGARRLGARGVRLRVEALELEQPDAEHRDHHRDHDQEDAQPGVRRPAAAPGRDSRRERLRGAGLNGSSPGCRRESYCYPPVPARIGGDTRSCADFFVSAVRGTTTLTMRGFGASTFGFAAGSGLIRIASSGGGGDRLAEHLAVGEPHEGRVRRRHHARSSWPGPPAAAGRGAARGPSPATAAARRARRPGAAAPSR